MVGTSSTSPFFFRTYNNSRLFCLVLFLVSDWITNSLSPIPSLSVLTLVLEGVERLRFDGEGLEVSGGTCSGRASTVSSVNKKSTDLILFCP